MYTKIYESTPLEHASTNISVYYIIHTPIKNTYRINNI